MNKLYNGGQGSKNSTVRVYDDCVEFKDPTFCIGWILRLRVEYALTCFTFATLKPYVLPSTSMRFRICKRNFLLK